MSLTASSTNSTHCPIRMTFTMLLPGGWRACRCGETGRTSSRTTWPGSRPNATPRARSAPLRRSTRRAWRGAWRPGSAGGSAAACLASRWRCAPRTTNCAGRSSRAAPGRSTTMSRSARWTSWAAGTRRGRPPCAAASPASRRMTTSTTPCSACCSSSSTACPSGPTRYGTSGCASCPSA